MCSTIIFFFLAKCSVYFETRVHRPSIYIYIYMVNSRSFKASSKFYSVHSLSIPDVCIILANNLLKYRHEYEADFTVIPR